MTMNIAPGGRRWRWLRRLALLACAILAFVSVGSATAQAYPASDEYTPAEYMFDGICDDGEFCLYENSNYGRPLIDYQTSDSMGGGRTCDGTYVNNNFPRTNFRVNDETSSWWNRTRLTVRIYDDSGYIGDSSDLGPGSYGNLRDVRVGQDDASSHRSIHSECY